MPNMLERFLGRMTRDDAEAPNIHHDFFFFMLMDRAFSVREPKKPREHADPLFLLKIDPANLHIATTPDRDRVIVFPKDGLLSIDLICSIGFKRADDPTSKLCFSGFGGRYRPIAIRLTPKHDHAATESVGVLVEITEFETSQKAGEEQHVIKAPLSYSTWRRLQCAAARHGNDPALLFKIDILVQPRDKTRERVTYAISGGSKILVCIDGLDSGSSPFNEVAEVSGVDSAGECAVCLGGMECDRAVRLTRCGHGFHAGCIERWRIQKENVLLDEDAPAAGASCPLCRMPIFFP